MRNPDLPLDTNIAIIVYSQTFAQHLSEANVYATISRHYKNVKQNLGVQSLQWTRWPWKMIVGQ